MSDYYKVVVKGKMFNTVEWRNVFYENCTSGSPGTTQWSARLATMYNDGWEGHCSVDWNIYGYDVYKWDGLEWQPNCTSTLSVVGTVAHVTAVALPTQMSLVIVAKTIYKRVFGRKNLNGLTVSAIEDGCWAAGTMVDAQTFGSLMTANWSHSMMYFTPVVQRKDHTFTPYTGYTVDSIPGTQRRRKMGVGI